MATFGNGATFKVGTTNTVSELTSIGLPKYDSDELETTTHGSTDRFRTYIKGLIDAGEIALEGLMNYAEYAQFESWVSTTSLYSITITVPTTPSVTQFAANGFIKSLESEAPFDDLVKYSAAVRVSGKPTVTKI